MLRLSKVRKIAFSFSLRSPYTIFRQDRRRLGNENKKRVFSFHCARLALSLQKELKNVENDTVNDGLRQGRCPL